MPHLQLLQLLVFCCSADAYWMYVWLLARRWLRVHNTDPLTNVVMSSTQTTQNIALRNLIEAWRNDVSGSV